MQYLYANMSEGKSIEGNVELGVLLKEQFSLLPRAMYAAGVSSSITHYVSDDLSVLHHPDEENDDGKLWHAHTFIIQGEKSNVECLVKELHEMYEKMGYKMKSAGEIRRPMADIPSLSSP